MTNITLWTLLIAFVVLALLAILLLDPTMSELGRKAVEEGVIQP